VMMMMMMMIRRMFYDETTGCEYIQRFDSCT
jgi:hypothetical protein